LRARAQAHDEAALAPHAQQDADIRWAGKESLGAHQALHSCRNRSIFVPERYSLLYFLAQICKGAEAALKSAHGAGVRVIDICRHDEVDAVRVQFSERLQTVRIESICIPFGFDRDRSLPLALDYKIHLVPLRVAPVHDMRKFEKRIPCLTKCNIDLRLA